MPGEINQPQRDKYDSIYMSRQIHRDGKNGGGQGLEGGGWGVNV